MNKSNVYLIIIVLLVFCNGILGFFLFTKPAPPHGHPDHKEPKAIIAEKLNFSEEQVKEYEELIKWHQHKIHEQEEDIKQLKTEFFHLLLKEKGLEQEEELEVILDQISAGRKNIERFHFQHFMDLKALCTAEQEENFEMLVEELGEIFAPPHHHKKKH